MSECRRIKIGWFPLPPSRSTLLPIFLFYSGGTRDYKKIKLAKMSKVKPSVAPGLTLIFSYIKNNREMGRSSSTVITWCVCCRSNKNWIDYLYYKYVSFVLLICYKRSDRHIILWQCRNLHNYIVLRSVWLSYIKVYVCVYHSYKW